MVARERLHLPSGRVLRYPGLRSRATHARKRPEWGYGPGKQWTKSYGGKIVENVVQAIARDVLWWQAERLRGALRALEARLVLRVHDELVLACPEGEAEAVRSAGVETLETPPAWMPGLPVAAEVGVGQSWGGAK